MRWLIMVVMVLGLAACGKKGDLQPPGGPDEPEQTSQTQTEDIRAVI